MPILTFVCPNCGERERIKTRDSKETPCDICGARTTRKREPERLGYRQDHTWDI